MKRRANTFTTPATEEVSRHLGALVRQARLARQWTIEELAERARIGTATLKRLEKATVLQGGARSLRTLELPAPIGDSAVQKPVAKSGAALGRGSLLLLGTVRPRNVHGRGVVAGRWRRPG